MRTTRRPIRLAALLLALAAAAGCGSSMSTESSAPAVAPDMRSDAAGGSSGGVQQSEPGAAQAAQVQQPGVDRKLVRTASLTLISGDVGETASKARQIAVAHDGYLGQQEVGQTSATMVLHVPSTKLDKVIDELSAESMGKVDSSTQSAQDVTEEVVDVESRIATQRASLDRVRALLGQAEGISEIVQLESEVTRREADLESLLKRREALAGSVAMSRVTLRVLPQEGRPAEDDDTLLGALATGWDAFLGSLNWLVRVIAVVLPFAVVVGVPLVVAMRWRRRARQAPQET